MIPNKFWCETYLMYPETNFFYIVFYKKKVSIKF